MRRLARASSWPTKSDSACGRSARSGAASPGCGIGAEIGVRLGHVTPSGPEALSAARISAGVLGLGRGTGHAGHSLGGLGRRIAQIGQRGQRIGLRCDTGGQPQAVSGARAGPVGGSAATSAAGAVAAAGFGGGQGHGRGRLVLQLVHNALRDLSARHRGPPSPPPNRQSRSPAPAPRAPACPAPPSTPWRRHLARLSATDAIRVRTHWRSQRAATDLRAPAVLSKATADLALARQACKRPV